MIPCQFQNLHILPPIHPDPVSISYLSPDGVYKIGDTIRIRVSAVDIYATGNSGKLPHTLVSLGMDGGIDRQATTVSTSFSGIIHYVDYKYTVQLGDYSGDLDYSSNRALHWSTGPPVISFINGFGGVYNCKLPEPGEAGSLSAQSDIVVDGVPPRVTGVAAAVPSGLYSQGDEISIRAAFAERVAYPAWVPPPTLTLDFSGAHRTAAYASGNNSDALVFNYTLQDGDVTGGNAGGLLDYGATSALAGASIMDIAGNAANLTLPAPGAPGSLGRSSRVAAGSVEPFVLSVSSPNATGAYYKAGDAVHVSVKFSEAVTVDEAQGRPTLGLETGAADRNATYATGSGSPNLVFVYAVMDGDYAPDLNYAGVSALSANGASIAGGAGGSAASLALPDPSARDSLAGTSGIYVDAIAPAVVGVSTPNASGVYGIGDAITVRVSFSEAVQAGGAPGSPPALLALDTGRTGRSATYASGSGTRDLVFAYAVAPGDRADDLGYRGTAALSGSVADLAGHTADLSLPPPGAAGSLSHSSDVLIDPVVPRPIAAGSARDGQNNFDALSYSLDADAVVVGGRTYAAVASLEGAVQLVRVHENGTLEAVAVARYTDSDFGRLRGAYGIDAFKTGSGAAYAIVASEHGTDGGVQLVRIHANGTLEARGSLGDNATLVLNGARRVAAFSMGGEAHALVAASAGDDGVQLVRIRGDGTLEARGSLGDNATLELDGAYGVAAFSLGGAPHALVAGHDDDGVQLVRIRGDGTLEARGSLGENNTHNTHLALDGPRDVAAFNLSGRGTHALVASEGDNGVQLIRIHANGTLEPLGSATDGARGFEELGDAFGVAAFKLGNGSAYAAVASRADDGVQLVRVRASDGALLAAGSAADGARGFDGLRGAFGIHAFELGGRTYAIAASAEGGAVQLIEMSPAAALRVGSAAADGVYRQGAEIDVTVAFSGAVRVAGAPLLELNSGGAARYHSGNNTAELVFRYSVQEGEQAADLDHAGAGALSPDGGAIAHAALGIPASLVLPPPGSENSLGGLKDIYVDARPPSVASVRASHADGAYGTGDTVEVAVRFDEPVAHSGAAPSLLLNVSGSARPAAYASGNGTDALVFSYAVAPGDRADDLGYRGTAALSGSVADLAGHTADLSLPPPGAAGSLSHSSDVLIDPVVPRPIAAGSARDGQNNFDALGLSLDVDTIVVGGRTYAAVASLEGAVQLVRVHENGTLEAVAVARYTDSDFGRLRGAYGIDAFKTGSGAAYAIVASEHGTDGGVQLVRIHANGTLEARGSLGDNATLVLNGARRVAAFSMGGEAHALVAASAGDDGVQLVRIRGDGTLEARGSLGDNATLELDGAYGVAAFSLGGAPHALVAGHDDDGVQLVRIRGDGTLEARGSLGENNTHNTHLALDGPRDVAAFNLSGRGTHALVASEGDNGVQLIRIHANGTLEPLGSATDGARGFEELGDAFGVAAFKLGNGSAYAAVASRADDGVQLVRVRASDDALLAAGSAADGARGFDGLDGAFGIHTFELGGRTYAIAASAEGGAVQLIEMSPAAALRVGSAAADGVYRQGAEIDVTVAFSGAVRVAGAPLLELNSGGAARYHSGNNTAELVFRYSVQEGEQAADLDHAGAGALSPGGGSSGAIAHAALGIPASLVLPPPGSENSLGGLKDIYVDARPPSVASVRASHADGAYGTGDTVEVAVRFDEPVAHSGAAPSLLLNVSGSARPAAYASGNGTDALVFSYAVAPGDRADDLGYRGTAALSGSVADLAGHTADLSLPPPGAAGSLSHSSDVLIDPVVPRPIAAGSARDGQNNFDALSYSLDADAVVVGGRTYAAVASLEGAVQLVRVHENSTLEAVAVARYTDSDFGRLRGAYGIDAFKTGSGAAYAIVASEHGTDGGVQLVRIHANGTLEARGSLGDNATLVLNGARRVAAFSMGGEAHALVAASAGDDGVQLVRIRGDGTLEARGSLGDNATLELDGAYGVAAFSLGGAPHALVAGHDDDGVQLVRIRGDGTLEARGSLGENNTHNTHLALDGPRDVAAFNLSGRGTHALVASEGDNGVQLIRIHANGTLEPLGSATDGARGFEELGDAFGVAAFKLGNGSAYAAVASRADDGVQLVRVRASDGALLAAGSAADGARGFDGLRGAFGIHAFELGGRTYAIAASAEGGAVQLMRLSRTSATAVGSAAADGAYGIGDEIDVTVAFDHPVRVAGAPLLELNSGGAAEYASGSGTAELVFRYSVLRGHVVDDLDYDGAGALRGIGGAAIEEVDTSFVADTTLPPPGTGRSLGDLADIAVDGVPPAVVSVSSETPDGAYGAGQKIAVAVAFSEPVSYPGGPPALSLNVGVTARPAPYESGNGTDTLVFEYEVAAGDRADDLDYAGTDALSGDGIADAAGNAANLTLPAPGSPGSLSGSAGIRIDTAQPRVLRVWSETPDGAYGADRSITVAVAFSEPVSYPGGPPALSLNVGVTARPAPYESGNGTDTLVFAYTVAAGDRADDLDYAGTDALSGDGIADAAGNAANLTLPAPGSPGSLSGSAGIRIDTAQPRVLRVWSETPDGAYGADRSITVAVAFSEPVSYPGGPPALSLNVGVTARPAPYESGNGTDTLVFAYTVAAGDRADDLDYAGTDALSGDGIADAAGNAANLTLPAPGSPGSLSGSAGIRIDTAPPRVVSVASPNEDGTYNTHEPVNITVAFDEPVLVEGLPRLALRLDAYGAAAASASASAHAEYSSGSGTDTLAFVYSPHPGDRAGDLEYANASALHLNGGSVGDAAGNAANLALPAPGSGRSLGDLKDIEIDASGAGVLRVYSPDPDGSYGAGSRINVTVSFSADVSVAGSPLLRLNTGGGSAAHASSRGPDIALQYEVRRGENAARLDYYDTASLLENGGTIAAADGGGPITLQLPPPGSPNSLAGSSNITVDTMPPRVVSVAAQGGGGAYGVGDTVRILAAFTEPVFVDGEPVLALNLPATAASPGGAALAAYSAGSGTDTLAFVYMVQPGDNADPLGYADTQALSLNGGSVGDAAGNDAVLGLPPSGSPGSLSGSAGIRIDTAPPRVVSVASPNEDGTYNTHEPVNITVAFDEPVLVEGLPRLALRLDAYGAAGAHAEYSSGSGTDTLAFVYSPHPGDRAGDLEYANASALHLNGGSVGDAAGNAANLALPAPGSGRSLGDLKDIEIDASSAGVLRVYSPDPDGSYGAGSRINVTVSFSADVSVGGSPLLRLNTGGGSAAHASSRGPDIALQYEVRRGENAARLDYYDAASLLENGGTIAAADGRSPITLQLPPPGSPNSLAGTSAIAVDTIPPRVVSVAAQGAGGAYGVGDTVRILAAFTEPVFVDGEPALELDAGAAAAAAPARAAYSAGAGTNTLAFLYTVRPGDGTDCLDYSGTAALSLNGGFVGDAAGNPADLALAPPGSQNSLGGTGCVSLRGAGGPADAAPAAPDAVFTAPNTIRIEYGAPLGPPAGHEGPVYGAVTIGEGAGAGARTAATAASGLGTAAHTVRLGGVRPGAGPARRDPPGGGPAGNGAERHVVRTRRRCDHLCAAGRRGEHARAARRGARGGDRSGQLCARRRRVRRHRRHRLRAPRDRRHGPVRWRACAGHRCPQCGISRRRRGRAPRGPVCRRVVPAGRGRRVDSRGRPD